MLTADVILFEQHGYYTVSEDRDIMIERLWEIFAEQPFFDTVSIAQLRKEQREQEELEMLGANLTYY